MVPERNMGIIQMTEIHSESTVCTIVLSTVCTIVLSTAQR